MNSAGQNAPTLPVIRIVWLALVVAIVIYGVLAFVIPPQAGTARTGFGNQTVLILYVAAALVLLTAVVFPRIMRRSAAANRDHTSSTQASAISQRAWVANVIRWALLEAIAILGLMASMIDGSPMLFLPLGLIAAAGMILSYPAEAAPGF